MTAREALEQAMGRTPVGDLIRRLQASGVALADEQAMSEAIHDCYCGPSADHDHPNDKDREQARAMLASLQRHSG